MQKLKAYIILSFSYEFEIFTFDRRYFHNRADSKIFKVSFGLYLHNIHFFFFWLDNFAQQRSDFHLFFRIETFKKVKKYFSDLFDWLTVYNAVPISTFYLFFTNFSVWLFYTFLKFQKIFIIFFPHRIVANGVYHILYNLKCFWALI